MGKKIIGLKSMELLQLTLRLKQNISEEVGIFFIVMKTMINTK